MAPKNRKGFERESEPDVSLRSLHRKPRSIVRMCTEAVTFRFLFVDEGTCIARHRHDRATIIYAVGGPGVEEADVRSPLKRLTYHPPGHEHSFEFTGAANLFLFEVSEALTPSSDWPERSMVLPVTLYGKMWDYFLRIAAGAEQALDRPFVEFVEQVLGYAKKPVPDRLQRVLNQIHAEWQVVPSIRDLSARHGVSKQYLSYIFKKHLGVTTRQYAVLLRLDHARNLLWGTDVSLADVAAETGFADQSHLTRAFQAALDHTPLQYRKCGPSRTFESVRQLPRESRRAFINDLIDELP